MQRSCERTQNPPVALFETSKLINLSRTHLHSCSRQSAFSSPERGLHRIHQPDIPSPQPPCTWICAFNTTPCRTSSLDVRSGTTQFLIHINLITFPPYPFPASPHSQMSVGSFPRKQSAIHGTHSRSKKTPCRLIILTLLLPGGARLSWILSAQFRFLLSVTPSIKSRVWSKHSTFSYIISVRQHHIH